ncbi:CYTH domain-containing protein [Orbaceae bacterium ESL0727]|nr:CYTH domain-containing protein [Orbaceae bacterium ESL0727]
MNHEIELKFEINAVDIAPLATFLTQWVESDHVAAAHPLAAMGDRGGQKIAHGAATPAAINRLALINRYYDTADYYLRQHGYGLRVRGSCDNNIGCNDNPVCHSEQNDEQTANLQNYRYEITVKHSGTITAGLHERAEFNADLPNAELDLSVLPAIAFPPQCDIKQLQQNLIPLFCTNFRRKTWLIAFANSEIEVALDQGNITAQDKVMPIQELELEIKQGNKRDLVNFAMELSRFHLHLFSQSKAARGYRLYQNQPLTQIAIGASSTTANLSGNNAAITDEKSKMVVIGESYPLSQLLHDWQQNEEYALAKGDLSVYLQTLAQVKQALSDFLASQGDYNLMVMFVRWCSEFPVTPTVAKFAYSEVNTQLKLALIALLLTKESTKNCA